MHGSDTCIFSFLMWRKNRGAFLPPYLERTKITEIPANYSLYYECTFNASQQNIISYNSTTVVVKIIRTLVFSPAKNLKSVISIFCCSVSVGNISLHFQTFILPLIVIIQWDFCLHKESDNSQCSTQRSDLIIIQSVWNDMKKQNKLRQTQSRRTVATSPRCFKKPTCKATVLLKVLGTCVKML